MKLALATIVLAAALAPAFSGIDSANACQPLTWICPLNGQYYHTCGTHVPPPLVWCAENTLRDASVPALP